MFRDTRAFSGFAVPDLEAAKDFYGNTLGMEVVDIGGLLQLKVAGGTDIIIYPKPDHAPAVFTILNFPVQDVDTAVDELMAKGVSFEIYDEPGLKTDEKGIARGGEGPVIAWFRDPAGNILSVLEEM